MQSKSKVLIAVLLVIGFAGCSNDKNSADQAQYAALMHAYLASMTASSMVTATAVLTVTATTIVSASAIATSTTVSTSVTTVTPAARVH